MKKARANEAGILLSEIDNLGRQHTTIANKLEDALEKRRNLRREIGFTKTKPKKGGGGSGGQGGHEPTPKGPVDTKPKETVAPKTPAQPTAPKDATTPSQPQQGIQGIAEDAAKYKHGSEEWWNKELKSGEAPKVREDPKARMKEVNAKLREGGDFAKRLVAEVPELRGITGSTPKEIYKNALGRLKQVPGSVKLTNIVLMLQNAYGLVESAKYILEAKSISEGISRALSVGAEIANGTAEFELVALITRRNPVAMAGYAVGEILLGENEEPPKHKRQRLKNKTIGRMLENLDPGSKWLVGTGDEGIDINGRMEEWNLAVQTFNQARKDFLIEEAKKTGRGDGFIGHTTSKDKFEPDEDDKDAGITQKELLAAYDAGVKEGLAQKAAQAGPRKKHLFESAHGLGILDGKAGEEMTSKDEMKTWPDFKQNVQGLDADTRFLELFEYYKKGFNEGNKKRAALFQRVRDLGRKDGKIGKELHIDDYKGWPEVKQIVSEGSNDSNLYREIYEQYREAFRAVQQGSAPSVPK